MNGNPDKALEIFWGILFDNGLIALDQTQQPGEISEWFKVQQEVCDLKINPVSIKLFKKDNATGSGYKKVSIETKGSSNFFFSKKLAINLGDHNSHEAFGIGFYDQEINLIQISWFDRDLNLIESEQRNLEKCADLLIPKIGTQTLSQS
jgi:hypothetical protein